MLLQNDRIRGRIFHNMEKQKKSSVKKQVGLVIGGLALASIGLVVALIFVIMTFISKTPQAKLASTFVDHLAAEQYEEAYELTSTEFQEVTNLEDLQTFAEYYRPVDTAERVSFNYHHVEDGVHLLSGTLFGDEEQLPLTVEIVMEGEAWKMSFFSVDEADVPTSDSFDVDEF